MCGLLTMDATRELSQTVVSTIAKGTVSAGSRDRPAGTPNSEPADCVVTGFILGVVCITLHCKVSLTIQGMVINGSRKCR